MVVVSLKDHQYGDSGRIPDPVPDTVEVLEVPMYDGSIDSAAEIVIRMCMHSDDRLNRRITATGAHGLVTAARRPQFREILRSAYMNLPDGMPGVWVGRLKGAKRIMRCYGPDFMEAVLRRSACADVKHFFCGGKDGVAAALEKVTQTTFGNVNVVGTFSPPFRELSTEEFREIGERIDMLQTDIVWIGISTPKQEIFARNLGQFANSQFIISVGAAFDFHIGAVRQAPAWMQRSGLEWFFRVCVEPRRLFRRYAEIVPLFVLLNMREYISFLSKKVTNHP